MNERETTREPQREPQIIIEDRIRFPREEWVNRPPTRQAWDDFVARVENHHNFSSWLNKTQDPDAIAALTRLHTPILSEIDTKDLRDQRDLIAQQQVESLLGKKPIITTVFINDPSQQDKHKGPKLSNRVTTLYKKVLGKLRLR